ncbi:AlpA family transcriptional regulator [Crenobacter caeni]|uniref:AlpA family transcriptional regulator n=1 Tax=Crenobacter caeni TaxID=2705474 RepID=A0A6B2KNF7_9NEIS|nr:AlpA family transcriptional regulator [Crenobacter caeni]NDV11710.1 AlpA family transcriptional regulator [Crenobacter caeni]
MTTHTIIRRPHVEEKTGLSRSAIYDRMNRKSPRYDPTFPRSIRLGGGAVGWVEAELDAWIQSCIDARNAA